MRNRKFLIMFAIIMLLVVSMTFVFAACDPEGGGGGGGGGGDNEDPIPPPPPVDDVKLSSAELVKKIFNSIDKTDKVVHIDMAIDVKSKDKKSENYNYYRLSFKANVISKSEINLALVVTRLGKNTLGQMASVNQEIDAPIEMGGKFIMATGEYEVLANAPEKDEVVFGIYGYDRQTFVDLGDNLSMILLEDFDLTYMAQIFDSIFGMIGGLGDIALGPITVSQILDLLLGMLFDSKPTMTKDANGMELYSVELTLNKFVNTLPELFDLVSGILGGILEGTAGDIFKAIDLGAIAQAIKDAVPQYTIMTNALFDKDVLKNLEIDVKDNNDGSPAYGKDVLNIKGGLIITDIATAIDMPEKPEDFRPFSLTNIKFDIDLKADTKGNESVSQDLDVGALVNLFTGKKTLPTDKIMMNMDLGFRLSVSLDLDLNYNKEPGDKNLIAIELFALNKDGTPEAEPLIGIYYVEGFAYINLDNLAPPYYSATNIKISAKLNELITVLVDKLTNLIDDGLGTEFRSLPVPKKGASNVEANNAILRSMMSEKDENGELVNPILSLAIGTEERDPVISQGFTNFWNALMGALKLLNDKGENEYIVIEGDKIQIKFNNGFLETLSKAIGIPIDFELPGDMTIGLCIDFFDKTNEDPDDNFSVAITAKIDKLNLKVKAHNMGIGFEDKALKDRIEKGKESTVPYSQKLSDIVTNVLGGINLSANLTLEFNKGVYNLAPLLAAFGLTFMEKEKLLWEFAGDFKADVGLQVQIALDKENPSNSILVFELKTMPDVKDASGKIIKRGGIIIGEGENEVVLMAPDTVMLGVYGYKNSVYIDVSNIKIANIQLPKLKADLNFTDLFYNLIGEWMKKTFKATNGDYVLDFDLVEMLFPKPKPEKNSSTLSTSNSSYKFEDRELTEEEKILVALSSEELGIKFSLAAVFGLLKDLNVLDDETLGIINKLNLKLNFDAKINRNEGLKLEAVGEIVPLWNGSENVYGSDFKLTMAIGSKDFPLHVGDLEKQKIKFDMAKKEDEFKAYQDDLVQAIVDTIGKLQLDLKIDLRTFESKFDIGKIINGILASQGKSFALPIIVDLDDGDMIVDVNVRLNLNLKDFMRTQLEIKMIYEGKTMLSVALYRGSLFIDLTGLGFFKVEITNSPIVKVLNEMIAKMIADIGDFNLTETINELLKDYLSKPPEADLPTGGTGNGDKQSKALATGGSAIPTQTGDEIFGDMDDKYVDLIKVILGGLSASNTTLSLDFTSDVITALLKSMFGVDLGIDLSLRLDLDALNGSLKGKLGINDVVIELSLLLKVGSDFDLGIKHEEIPDWDATTGRQFAKSMLDNLEIGFNLDLRNNAPGTIKLAGGQQYTRITIEKIKADRVLYGTYNNDVVAPANSFLVTLSGIDKQRYEDTTKGNSTAILYAILDYNAGVIRLSLCTGVLNLIVDFAQFIKNIEIQLDLVATLGDVFQGLFDDMSKPPQASNQNGQILAASDEGEIDESPFAPLLEVFNSLDVMKLLGAKEGNFKDGGLRVTVNSSNALNVNVKLNPYIFNKLIDDVMHLVFGPNTVLNLAKLAPSIFGDNYLSYVRWGRINSTALWNTLDPQLVPILKDVIRNVEGGAYSALAPLLTNALLSGVKNQIKVLITRFLPLPVFDTVNVGLNINDGTLTSLYVDMYDRGETIYIDNDPNGNADPVHGNVYFWRPLNTSWALEKYDSNRYNVSQYATGGSNPGNPYATEIRLYNVSDAVGNPSYNNGVSGVVLWKDIPAVINYDKYNYTNNTAGYNDIVSRLVNKEVTYQKQGVIQKKRTGTATEFEVYKFNNETKVFEHKGKLSDSKNLDLQKEGKYELRTSILFADNNRKEKIITLNVAPEGTVERFKDISLFAYQELPDTLVAEMEVQDGVSKTRRYNTSNLVITGKMYKYIDKDGNTQEVEITDGTGKGYQARMVGAHEVYAKVVFPNDPNKEVDITIKYKDSSIVNVFGGKNIEIDLYKFNIDKNSPDCSKVEDFMGDGKTLYFQYNDESFDSLPVVKWNTSDADELFNRNPDDVRGARYIIWVTVGEGALVQNVPIIFEVKSKNVNKVNVNDRGEFITVDPYLYYMYLLTGDEKYNPYPGEIEVYYYDEGKYTVDGQDIKFVDDYKEKVSIKWSSDEGNEEKYNWDNNNKEILKKQISLDKSNPNYTGSFTWTKEIDIRINNNKIRRMYFDDEQTKSSLNFQAFAFNNNKENNINNFPTEAYVEFTNGLVIKMPIAWEQKARSYVADPVHSATVQFGAVIGYDQDAYETGSTRPDYDIFNGIFYQSIDVKVVFLGKELVGLNMDGSALNKNTKFNLDPVKYWWYADEKQFPTTVVAKYSDDSEENMAVIEWIFEEGDIKLNGNKDMIAKCMVTKNVGFDIKVNVLDRSDLTEVFGNDIYYLDVYEADGRKTSYSDLSEKALNEKLAEAGNKRTQVFSQLNVNSYNFKQGAYGLRTYEQFANIVNAKSFDNFEVKVYGKDKNLIEVKKFATVAEKDKFVQQVADRKDEQGNSLEQTTEVNVQNAEYKIAAKWNTSEINYGKSGIYNVKMTLGERGSLTKTVKVRIIFDKPDYIGGENFVVELTDKDRNGATYTNKRLAVVFEAKQTGNVIREALVNTVMCEIDIDGLGTSSTASTLEYDYNNRLVPMLFLEKTGAANKVNITKRGGKVVIYTKNGVYYYMEGEMPMDKDITMEKHIENLVNGEEGYKKTVYNQRGDVCESITYYGTATVRNITILPGTELENKMTVRVHTAPKVK